MEINLSAMWNGLTAPIGAAVRGLKRLTKGGRSHRDINFTRSSMAPSRRAAQFARSRQSSSRNPLKNVTQGLFMHSSGRPLTPTEKRLRLIRWLRLASLGLVLLVIAGLTTFIVLVAIISRDLPQPGKVVRHEGFSTKIFDRNGKLLYDLFSDERRDPVTIDQIPDNLKKATVAVEDKDFYRHQGFDPLTPFRIVYNYIFRRGRVVGGSTLTQQLVKMVLLTSERTPMRKFRELVLAVQIERKFSKDQILEMYLNEAPYGGNASGVGAAAEVYFNKPVKDLDLAQSAILAGLPQSPSRYAPTLGKTDANGDLLWKQRTLGVLRRMQEDGYINKQQYDQAVAELDTIQFESIQTAIKAPHFVFYVRDLLEKQFGQAIVDKGGLQVTTTLDLDLQDKAQQIVKDEISKVENVHITNGSAMVMNPKTGEILSMVGSADYNSASISGKFNVAVDGLRQPGSSIKPVTYLAMLRKGFTPASMLVDAPTKFQQLDSQDPYEPKNYDGKFRGPVSLRNSLGNSLNINSVKALAIVGIENFLQITDQMGFPTLQPTQENLKRFGLALTLGGGEVHLIDTVSAYSAFANGGTRVEPNAILKVTDAKGNNLYEFRPVEGPRVMTPEEAFLIDNILSDNTARTMAFGANSLLNTNKPIAVKTGTTNDRKDNWAIGWSQDFMVGVWVGNSDNTAMKAVASGVSGASPIWRKIVNDLLARGYKAPDWVVPPGVEQVEVDDISGHPKHDDFPSHPEWVIKGTVPANPDPIHEKLKLCKGENKLATDARVASGDYEEKEFVVLKEDDPYSKDGKNRWQEGIDGWVNASTDGKYKVPTEYCGENSDIFVRINQPEDQHKYDSEDIEIDVTADSGDGIEKIEIWVDGSLKETVNSNHYHNTLKLPAGRHEVYGKAKSRGGKEASTGTMHIGTGGQDWKAPDPSPTPSPSPSPSPSPTPAGITGCNTACTTDAQCTTLNPLLSCSVAQGNKCRLTSNPALATCQ